MIIEDIRFIFVVVYEIIQNKSVKFIDYVHNLWFET